MRESNLKARVKHNLTYFFPMFPFDPLENIIKQNVFSEREPGKKCVNVVLLLNTVSAPNSPFYFLFTRY